MLPPYLESLSINREEVARFHNLLEGDISTLPEPAIRGSGYVLHSLEAATWCLLTTDSFEAAVLCAVNLGEDSDTTGAVTGGLAALLYGGDAIPAAWIDSLARVQDIEDLADRCAQGIQQSAR